MAPMPLERWMRPSEWGLLYGFSSAQVAEMIKERELPVLETSQGTRVLDIGWDLVLDARRHRRNIDDLPILRGIEVAELLGTNTANLREMRKVHTIQHFTGSNGDIRFSVNQVRRYLLAVHCGEIKYVKSRRRAAAKDRIHDWAAKKLAQELASVGAPA